MVESEHCVRPSPFRNGVTSHLSELFFAAALLAAALSIACGGSGNSDPPPPPPVNVTPSSLTLGAGETQQFSVTGASTVTWEVNSVAGGSAGSGTIDSTGLYRAPGTIPSPPTVTVSAVPSGSVTPGTAAVTIVLAIAVSPTIASLTTSQTLQLQASGPGITDSNVTWAVDGLNGGNSTAGVITASGLYAPPASAGVHSVTATAAAGPSAAATVAVTDFAGTFSWRNDNGLTGQNRQELAMTAATVAAGDFGKLFRCAVDGSVYAQPLYYANLNVSAGGTVHHNVVFVATEHDSVYAFDADANPCQQIWRVNFVSELGGSVSGISTIPACPLAQVSGTCRNDVGTNDIVPEIGITGTPVIDPSSGTLYVVAASKENGSWVQRLHAIDVNSGADKFGGPVAIAASVPGVGDGSSPFTHQVAFDPLRENQRPALQLSGGTVYIAWGSHGDNTQLFHGWLLAYNAANLAQTAAFNSTPNGSRGATDQSGAAPAADSGGNIFLATGNGTFDVSITGAPFHNDYGESLLRMTPGLAVNQFFTPFDQLALNAGFQDLDASGVMLLPDAAGTVAHPHLALLGSQSASLTGIVYLADRDNLSGFVLGGPDHVLQQLALPGVVWGTPAYWQGGGQNTIYTAASGDMLKAFPLTNAALPASPTSASGETFAFPGASPAVTSNGSTGGIVWLLDTSAFGTPGAAVLHAYDATNLASELYNSSAAPGDAAGNAVKFAVPTGANGKVYVGTQTELTVYGFK